MRAAVVAGPLGGGAVVAIARQSGAPLTRAARRAAPGGHRLLLALGLAVGVAVDLALKLLERRLAGLAVGAAQVYLA